MNYFEINNNIRNEYENEYTVIEGRLLCAVGCWIGDGKKRDFWADFILLNVCGLLPAYYTLVLTCYSVIIPGIIGHCLWQLVDRGHTASGR